MQSYNFTRSVPVEEGYDVLVAGGGPAGSAAAVCAARLGAKVLLVEATGSLGGMSTSGLVTTFGPMGDGERTLVGGFTRELIETMHERGYLGPEVTPEYWITHYNRWIPFDPEALKRLLDEYCVEAGVEIRYFTRVIDADVEGRTVNGAIISNIEGLKFIKAKTFIDCTGDAVLADACGAECKVAGRDWPFQPATVCSTFSGINWDDPAYTHQPRHRCDPREGEGRIPAAGQRRRTLHPSGPLHRRHEEGRPDDRQSQCRPHLRPRRAEREEPVEGHDRGPQGRRRIYGVLSQIRSGLRTHRACRHVAGDGRARHPPHRRRVRADHRALQRGAPVSRPGRGLQPARRRALDQQLRKKSSSGS